MDAATLETLLADVEQNGLEIPADTLDAEAPRLAEFNFPFFCWYYGRQHLYDEIAPFQMKLMEELQALPPGRNAELLLPRGHGKSTLITFLFVLWSTVYRKRKHMLVVSSTADNAQKFLGKINQELRSNELIRRDFGDLSGFDDVGRKETWKASKLKTTNQVIISAIGTNGAVRGANESLPDELAESFVDYNRFGKPLYKGLVSFRPDLIICDDIVELKWIKSKKVRDDTETWFWTALINTLDAEHGNLILVGTTLHDDDLPSRIFRDKERTFTWLKKKLPACRGFDPKTKNPIDPLWPGYWMKPDFNKPVTRLGELIPLEQLHLHKQDEVFYLTRLYWKRVEIGERAFAQEYLLEPLSGSLKYFPRERFKFYILKSVVIPAAQEKLLAELGIMPDLLPDDLICCSTIDPAGTRDSYKSREQNSDFTAIATVGYSPGRRRFYILDVDRQRITPQVTMQLVLKHYQLFNAEFGGIYYTSADRKQSIKGFQFQHLGILVEAVAYQKALGTMLDELAPVLGMYPRVIEIKRSQQDKLVRATSVSPIFERGQAYWPLTMVPGMNKKDIDEAMDEMDKFPEGDHDDCVDCIVDAFQFLNRMSLSLNRGLAAIMVMKSMVEASPEMYAFVAKAADRGMDTQDAMMAFSGRQVGLAQ